MVIEGITTIETIIGQIIEIDQKADGTTIGQVIGAIIIRITLDEVIQDQITDKMPNGLLGTKVIVGIEMKITIMIIQEVGVEIDMIIDPFSREERNLGPDLTPGSILITIEQGVIDVENTTTSCLNALIPQLMKNQIMMMQFQHLCR